MCINMMENILQQLAVDIFGRNRHIGSLSEESEKGKIKIASLLIHTDTQQVFKRVSLYAYVKGRRKGNEREGQGRGVKMLLAFLWLIWKIC